MDLPVVIIKTQRRLQGQLLLHAAVGGAVIVGQQSLTLVKQGMHTVHHLRIAPGHGGGAVRVPGMNGKAGLKYTVLNPTQQQLLGRHFPGKAAQIVAVKVKAGQAQGHAYIVTVAQIVEGCIVVTAPGLGQPSQTDPGTAGRKERPFCRAHFHLSLIGTEHH